VCGSLDFIHEMALARQEAEADEVLCGLPPELAQQIDGQHQEGIFSLAGDYIVEI
jgi:hypothetical protein